jgi:hypothetical protein
MGWDIFRDDRACTDYGAPADPDSGKQLDPHSYPYIIFYRYRQITGGLMPHGNVLLQIAMIDTGDQGSATDHAVIADDQAASRLVNLAARPERNLVARDHVAFVDPDDAAGIKDISCANDQPRGLPAIDDNQRFNDGRLREC